MVGAGQYFVKQEEVHEVEAVEIPELTVGETQPPIPTSNVSFAACVPVLLPGGGYYTG